MFTVYIYIYIYMECGGATNAGLGSVDIIKGFTRATCVATLLAAAAELELGDPATIELLKPIHNILDKCWLVPVHVTGSKLIKVCSS